MTEFSRAIKGNDPELPFKHIAHLNDTNEEIEFKDLPEPHSILIRNGNHYILGEIKSTSDHVITYYYSLVNTFNLD